MHHRILHLENNANDAFLTEQFLARAGLAAELVVATGAAEFRAALAQQTFDLVLSDGNVPGFSGLEALHALRAKHPRLPFICLSGHLDERAVQRYLAAGATACVLKHEPPQLIAAVRTALDAGPPPPPPKPAQPEPECPAAPAHGVTRLVAAVQELSQARSVEAIREIVRRAARELTGADGATFVLRDGDRCYYVDEDAISPLWKGQKFPMQTCISGWAMRNKQSAVIEDIYADPRISHDAYRPTFVQSLVMVPIRSEALIGAIGNYWARRHAATPQEVELLQSLANTTAVAMENVQVYAELEQRVKDRTTQYEAANHELEAFSYSVSHDLRAPLHVITSFAQLLHEDYGRRLGGPFRDATDRMLAECQRMAALIEDLLRLSQLNRRDLKIAVIDLGRTAREILALLQAAAPGRPVETVIADNLLVEGDPGLLRVALENLLSNAWKYTGKLATPARIELGATTVSDGATAYFVRDNGAGFDLRHAQHLFAPFQRLHDAKDFPGTGVGLATVQRVIHKHGGRIWAESAPGQGATFYFTLPPSAS